MTQTDASPPGTDATGAASDATVTVDLARSEQDARAAVAVLAQVWSRDDGQGNEPMPPELAWAFAHSGNYVALARLGGRVIGSAIAFRGSDEDGPLLHSHITGVLPDHQGLGVGYRLKQHQRSWALAAGLERVTWTFDPLVARNGYFNVVKLGAQLTRYYVHFYGEMDDGINTGDETDRCLVTWRVGSPQAAAAAAGVFTTADVPAARAQGAVEVLRCDADGSPRVQPAQGQLRLVQVPADVVELRHREPALARSWRQALREVLVSAFADGLEVVGVGSDGWYVVGPPPPA
jgi:predicted GNAT superfamily acetyltransferase